MKDSTLMTAIVAGGAGAVLGALYMISKAKAGSPMIADAGNGVGAVIAWQPRRQLRGWGNWGTPGFGRGMGRTGAAVYWRKVA